MSKASSPFVIKGGYMFARCPTSWKQNEGREVSILASDVSIFIEYKVLPVAGGLLDQSPKFLQALPIVSRMIGGS